MFNFVGISISISICLHMLSMFKYQCSEVLMLAVGGKGRREGVMATTFSNKYVRHLDTVGVIFPLCAPTHADIQSPLVLSLHSQAAKGRTQLIGCMWRDSSTSL